MSNASTHLLINAGRLEAFAQAVMVAAGTVDEHARNVAQCLIAADLAGVETHGIARLPVYAKRLKARVVNPRPKPAVHEGRGGAATVDGDNGLGPVAARIATEVAIRRAKEHGVAWVVVRNSNHFGFASFYCELAAAAGMIGLASSSGEPSVAPWGGSVPFFANNPFALAAPTSAHPVVVDMATSVTARGRIMLAQQTNSSIPIGWAVNSRGEPTTDPAAAIAGSVLPMAGAKGYALIVALEVLCGVLSGGSFAPQIGSQADMNRTAGVGHFIATIDPSAFMDIQQFISRMDRLVSEIRAAPRGPAAEILVPGDRRQRLRALRLTEGVPIHLDVLANLRAVATDFGVAELPTI